MTPTAAPVYDYLSDLQARICAALQAHEPDATFRADPMPYPNDGISRPHILSGGSQIEQAAVNFSPVRGDGLPPAATAR